MAARVRSGISFALGAACLAVLTGAAISPAIAQVLPAGRPQGQGLAAKHPGDAGIETEPAVLFVERFDGKSVADVAERWDAVSNKGNTFLALSGDVPAGSASKQSLQMTAIAGQNLGGYLYTRLPRGVDTAFVRFYVKFDSAHFAYPCGVHLGGYRPAAAYPQGSAGRPRGDDRMMAEIGPNDGGGKQAAPGVWGIAGFWPDMKGSADGNFWGNLLSPAEPARVARDQWQCVEVMLKGNAAPDKSDGELAMWVDGKLIMHIKPGVRRGPWSGMGFDVLDSGGEPFDGFRWRTTNELKVNFLWLLYNMTPDALRKGKTDTSRVWYSSIVVAEEYIGPLAAARPDAAAPPGPTGGQAVGRAKEAEQTR